MKRRTATVAAALLPAVAGCSKAPEYALPSSLCNVPVEPSVLGAVLLPGEKLEQSTALSRPDAPHCLVQVDKESILSVQGEVLPADQDPTVRREWQIPGATKIEAGDDARVSDINVVAVAACTYQGGARKFVVQAERFYPKRDDTAKRREALTNFMKAYFPAAQKAAGCTA
ncbi:MULTISPECIES: hypothetical protein [unclassified Streptomyces]|uniref:hypothetical protein n=1 Tax=unclassified Streptomyces TaxID=2593676 RepID=UPI001BE650E8|nr:MULTISPECIES: hypothetical protein [unclassified Streptomyces]MBT2404833.1 hypothetical protein [Streptomyces sp. ISL-21]MBT2612549.1 hypothetical protein [Streptomyces sp. ISL-87]